MTEHSAFAVAPTRLRLIGGWQLLVDGTELDLGHREQRLVALLGLGDRSPRAQVASALWPDSTDERALASLRRAVLQCQRRCPGLLVAERLTIALDPSVRVDVDDLRRAGGLTLLPMTDAVAHELLAALQGDELLPGWYDDWAVHERGTLEQLRAEALERLALHGLENGDLELAVEAARTVSATDPLREWPREVAIRASVALGDVAGATQELQRYTAVLHDDLGVAPSSRITGLVEPPVDGPRPAPGVVTPPRPRTATREALVDVDVPGRGDDGPWEAGTTSLDEFLDGPRSANRSGGVRRSVAALVAVAGTVLAVSLAVGLSGPDEGRQATGDPGGAEGVDPVPPSSPEQDVAAPSRTVLVRTVDSTRGSTAVFDVRADQRPAQVRLVVRGRAGLRVVRHVVVRAAAGRDVVVAGLDPGTYTWSATSASASPVGGEVSVAPDPAGDREDETPAGVTPGTTQVASTTSSPSVGTGQAPAPTTSDPTSHPTPTPSPSPTPSPHPSHSATPHSTPSTSPTGTPRDPGTVAPPPVG